MTKTTVFDYKALVCFELNKMMIPELDKEELVNDVLMKAYLNYHKYDDGKGKISTWIRRIAKNTAIDYFRKKKHRVEELQDWHAISNDNIGFSNTGELMLSVLSSMSEKDQKIISFFYLKGYKYKEISEKIGLPVNRVGQEIRRALTRMKKRLIEIGVTHEELLN